MGGKFSADWVGCFRLVFGSELSLFGRWFGWRVLGSWRFLQRLGVGVEVLPPPECDAKGVLASVEGGEYVSPNLRRSGRKKPLRSNSGHLLKSRPLSPMMRMAEMRRNGLR